MSLNGLEIVHRREAWLSLKDSGSLSLNFDSWSLNFDSWSLNFDSWSLNSLGSLNIPSM